MNDLVPSNNLPADSGISFNRPGLPSVGINSGSVEIESQRAIAEAQGQLILAKRFPRDLNAAYAELMDSCKLQALARVAFYSVPRGKGQVSGPSIRLAEEIARVFGNFEFGHRELSRTDGKSEIEVYAWDKEKNNRSIRQITVMHTIDTQQGPRKLRDQKDIDDRIANVASKQARGRILALMPKWLVESAIEECKKTLAGTNSEPIAVRVRKMTQGFAAFGVNPDHLERYLGHKLDDTTLDELVELIGVFNAIKDGAKAGEYFEAASGPDLPTVPPAGPQITPPANDNAPHPAAARRQRQPREQPPAQQQQAATAQTAPEPPAQPPAATETADGPVELF